MRRNRSNCWVFAVLVLSAATWSACDKSNTEGTSAASAGGGKIPITTKSEDARKEFLAGRDLSEKLQAQDSVQHFDKAIALDPEFATAELARANAGCDRQGILRAFEQGGGFGGQGFGRRETYHSRNAGRREWRHGQAEGRPRETCGCVSQRRAGAFQPGRIRVWATGLSPRPSST